MKTCFISSIIVLSLGVASIALGAEPDKQLTALQAKVQNELSTGALTQSDADELSREIQHAESIADRGAALTHATKRDARQDVAKIEKDLARKEAVAKAMAAASASPAP